MGLIGLMGLVGCSVVDTDIEDVAGLEPVGFNAYVARPVKATRADAELLADLKIPDGKSIGVFGYYHQGEDKNGDGEIKEEDGEYGSWSNSSAPNFMFNQCVTYHEENNSFTYSPLKYWPNSPYDRLSFIAYYPYCDGSDEQVEALGITPPTKEDFTGGLPTLKLRVKDDPEKQVDLILTELVANQEKPALSAYTRAGSDGQVHLSFRHATPKVKFHVTIAKDLEEDLASLRVIGLGLTDIYYIGEYRIYHSESEANPTGPGGPVNNTDISLDSIKVTINRDSINDNVSIVNASSDVNHLGEIYLMLPQELSPSAKLSITYEVTFRSYRTVYEYDDDGNLVEKQTYSYTKTVDAVLNEMRVTQTGEALTEWEANTQYIYTIRVGAEKVGFTAQVVDWGEEVTIPTIDIEDGE